MDFAYYLDFNRRYLETYGWLERDFPHAALVLDKELRNTFFGNDEIVAQNTRRLARHGPLKEIYLSVARGAVPTSNAQGTYYLKLDGFGQLRERIGTVLASQRMAPFSAGKVLGLSRNRLIHGLATRGRAYPRMIARVRTDGFDAVLQQRDMLQALDDQIARNVEAVRGLIRTSGIRLFLSDGDAMPFQRVICRAAQLEGVPYVVLAHGYIADTSLITAAPIHADLLVMWTERQAQEMRRVLSESEASRVTFFGYPKDIVETSPATPPEALIAWESLAIKPYSEEEYADLFLLSRRLAEFGFRPRLRLHPKDRRDAVVRHRLEAGGQTVSERRLNEDIAAASVVFGSNTSVLVEAAACGRPAFQKAESIGFDFEWVDVVSFRDPDLNAKVRSAMDRPRATPEPFDVEAFFDRVRKLL